MAEMDSEAVKLRTMVPLDNRTEAGKEKVELTAVEKARLQTEPVKYHQCIQQDMCRICAKALTRPVVVLAHCVPTSARVLPIWPLAQPIQYSRSTLFVAGTCLLRPV